MMIPKETIERFKQAYFEEFGKEISDKDARDELENLVLLLELLLKD